jgi:hypothetical protein
MAKDSKEKVDIYTRCSHNWKVEDLLNELDKLINNDERGNSFITTSSGVTLSKYKIVIEETTQEERELEFEKKLDV